MKLPDIIAKRQKLGDTAVLGAIGAFGLYAAYTVLPYALNMLNMIQTGMFRLLAIGAAAVVGYVGITMLPTLIRALKVLSRFLTNQLVAIDPIGFMKEMMSKLQERQAEVREKVGALNVIALGISTAISFAGAYLTVVGAFAPSVEFLSKLRFLGFTGLTFVFGMYSEGRSLQVWMLVFGISTFFLTSMMTVVASVPKAKLDHARTLRMGPWRTLWEVVVRGTLSDSIDVLRQSAAIGWVMLTMVEGLVRSQGGVGVLLIDLNRRLALDGILAVAFVITGIGIAQDFIINQLRLMVCPHVR